MGEIKSMEGRINGVKSEIVQIAEYLANEAVEECRRRNQYYTPEEFDSFLDECSVKCTREAYEKIMDSMKLIGWNVDTDKINFKDLVEVTRNYIKNNIAYKC
jgi:hypothetical protein